MPRPNPSCRNEICGPVLHTLECAPGCWHGIPNYTAGLKQSQISEIMNAKRGLFTPKIAAPVLDTWLPLSTVNTKPGETKADDARIFWLRLKAHGYVD